MAARSIASGVALNFGLISTSVSMISALDKTASGNVTVCDAGHEAQRVRMPRLCPTCGEVPFQQLKKAHPVDGGLVVLEAADLEALNATAAEFRKRAPVSAHPAEQVEVLTGVGERMYHLTPDKGHEVTYSVVHQLVSRHPELAFIARWTPRTALGQYQLRAFNGVLMLQERVSAGSVREAPEVSLVDNGQLLGLAEQVLQLNGSITDYDPAVFADDAEERMAALLKGRPVVPVEGSTPAPAANVEDLLARLAAEVAAQAKPKRRSRAKVA